MTRYILRRLAIIPVALLLVHVLGYAYAYFAGPIRAARTPYVFIQEDPPPFIPTYRTYVEGALGLDFGLIPGAQEPLPTVILRAAVASLGLLSIALILSVLVGVFLGYRATRVNPPRTSQWLTLVSTAGLAMPSFYIGSLFVVASITYVLSRGPGSTTPFPVRGFGWDSHLVFPTLALMVRPTVQIARMTSSLMVEEINKQYVVAARSVGHSWRAIRQHIVLSNISAPILLTISGSVRLLAGELILIEWLFHWPGLGRLLSWTLVPPLLTSSPGGPLYLDPPTLAAVVTVLAALFMTTDLVAGVLVRVFDPRIRASEQEGAHA